MTHAMNTYIDLQTEDLRLFVGCVSHGSLSAAAKVQGLTQAVASRRIQRLELAVGAPLLHRTTRSLRPTSDGERLLASARVMLAELTSLERSTRQSRESPIGEVRVSAPVLLAHAMGGVLATELAERFPELRLFLTLSNERVDLVRDGIDVALRVGSLPNTSLLSASVATARIGPYAQRAGFRQVKHPAELLELPWVGHENDAVVRGVGPAGERWQARVELSFTCDDRRILRDSAVAGLGVALLPTFLGDVEPTLRRLVPDWHFGRVPVRALWLPEARNDPRVRAVVEVVTRWGSQQKW